MTLTLWHSLTRDCSSSHGACQHLSICPRPSYWPVGSVTRLTLSLDCTRLIVAETWPLIFTRDFLKTNWAKSLKALDMCQFTMNLWFKGVWMPVSRLRVCKEVASELTMQLDMNTGCGLVCPRPRQSQILLIILQSYPHQPADQKCKICVYFLSVGRSSRFLKGWHYYLVLAFLSAQWQYFWPA